MIEKVKCVKDGCELKDQVITTTWMFMQGLASLKGPFLCRICLEPMKVVQRTPANYKPGAGAKTAPRSAISKPAAKETAAKKKVGKKKIVLKGIGPKLGIRFKKSTKAGPKKTGPRKRGQSK